jgi:hypothetical protein
MKTRSGLAELCPGSPEARTILPPICPFKLKVGKCIEADTGQSTGETALAPTKGASGSGKNRMRLKLKRFAGVLWNFWMGGCEKLRNQNAESATIWLGMMKPGGVVRERLEGKC